MRIPDIHKAVRSAAEAARLAEADLNAADATLGDGDTGVTVRRLFEALEQKQTTHHPDLGAAFGELARICASSTGSSLGTLVTVAMMTLSKSLAGRETLAIPELSGQIGLVRDQMLARGGASLGDKTVIDMLDAIARGTVQATDAAQFAGMTRTACDAALRAFRGRPCRIGRARLYPDRSAEADDPGMLACWHLVHALTYGECVHD